MMDIHHPYRISKPMKHHNRNKPRLKQRREEALQRQTNRAGTSDLDQLRILDARKVVAFKERARLHARILADKEDNKKHYEKESKQQEITSRQERQAAKKAAKTERRQSCKRPEKI